MSPASFADSMGLVKSADSTGAVIYKRQDGTSVISKGQKSLPELAQGKRIMVKITINDTSEYVYIRYGTNDHPGLPKCEMLIIDKDGNVDPSTPIIFDYYSLSEVKQYLLEDTGITLDGGTFITIANKSIVDEDVMNSMIPEGYVRNDGKVNTVGNQYYYYGRGIRISRSNTTIRNITHNITDESASSGYPYTGWLNVSYCNNTIIDNVKLTAHKTYTQDKNGPGLGGGTDMGSYDISALESNDITWKNCTQQNSITSGEFWGIMSSNFGKINLEGCYFNRFDNHAEACNASVKNSTLGRDFNLVGAGLLEVENVTRIVGDCFFKLRGDCGSTWEGKILSETVSLRV